MSKSVKSLNTYFKLNKSEIYITSLLNCLFNINLQIPINY